jgi:ABC-2 type transport system permease protein
MKKILAIVWKDTLVRFTGWSEWIFFLALPIVFTVILAGGTGASADARIRLVVVDGADSPLSADLIATLERSGAVRPDIQPLARAEDQFTQRQVSAVLIIPAEFDMSHLEQGDLQLELRRQPNNMNALVAMQAVQAAANRISAVADIATRSVEEAENIQPFASETDRQAYYDDALEKARALLDEAPARIATTRGATPDQIEYDPRANSSAGQLITWVFIPLIGISGMFAAERQGGTLRRLLVTPTRRATYLLGVIAGQVATALVQMLALVGFGIFVMGVNWGHSPAALAVILLSSALAAAALGATLGAFVKTDGQAQGLSIMTGMVMALLGGCWYPLELFPQFIRTAVKVLPTTWAMQGMLDIVLRGQGLSAVLPTAGVLLLFAGVFFAIGIWRFRYE